MPLEQLGAADRIQRIRQKIAAASPLPQTATASDVISVVEGRIARFEDGCCVTAVTPVSNPYKVAFVNKLSDPIPDPTFTRILRCINYVFPAPIPTGTIITLYNATDKDQPWQVGSGDVGPYYQAAWNSELPVGKTDTYTKTDIDGVISINYGKNTQVIQFIAAGTPLCVTPDVICLVPGTGVHTFPQIESRVVIQLLNTTGAINYTLLDVSHNIDITQGTVGYNTPVLYTVGPNDIITGIRGVYKSVNDPYVISIIDTGATPPDASFTSLDTPCTLHPFTLPNPDGQTLTVVNNSSADKTAIFGTGDSIPLPTLGTYRILLHAGNSVAFSMGQRDAFYFSDGGCT
jgi:hypothetical protein